MRYFRTTLCAGKQDVIDGTDGRRNSGLDTALKERERLSNRQRMRVLCEELEVSKAGFHWELDTM